MNVYTLDIDHKYGHDLYIHRTKEGAMASLYAYVSKWWDFEISGIPMPEDRDAAIQKYFENMQKHEMDD